MKVKSIYLIIANYNLTNTQIREYIDKRYKSEKYRNILKERIIDGRKLEYLAIKYYGDDNSPNKILLLEKKISKMTHNFALWLENELYKDMRKEDEGR